MDYDGLSQVSAGFRNNNGNNQRNEYRRSSDEPYNRHRHPRPYNVSPEDLLNGPCQMHFYVDADGRRQSGHLQKDCRTFQALRRATENTQAEAISRGFVQGPRSEIHVPLPPPPAINDTNQRQLQIAGPSNTGSDFTKTKGAVTMIQKGSSSNRSQKLISRQVNMAILSPPPTTDILIGLVNQ
jgi:hypothetical protein